MESTESKIVDMLDHELKRRTELNSAYSLRAFAYYLGLEPSMLSKILRRKYSITRKTALRLNEKLGDNVPGFEKTVSEYLKEIGKRKSALEETKNFTFVEADILNYISNWYYPAILHLIETAEDDSSPEWAAKRLDLPVEAVKQAYETLITLELMQKTPDGYKNSVKQISTLKTKTSSKYHRELQRQFLNKAIEALETVPISQRHQSSLTFTLDPQTLPEIIEALNSARRRINTISAEKGRKHTEIYNLSLSLYPLTKLTNSET